MASEQEFEHYCGIDVGTENIRCVIGRAPEKPGELPRILGCGSAKSFGVRRGSVVDTVAVAQSIDAALADAEKVSGVSVDGATFSMNGQHVKTYSSKGVAAIAEGEQVSHADLDKAMAAASIVQLPNNQRVTEIIAGGYSVDGQENVQDPTGMVGSRLEVEAVIISSSEIHLKNLEKAIVTANVNCNGLQPAVRAAAEATLTRQQRERGVIFVDIGAQTTSLAVYEEMEMKKIAVVPMGSSNITNDLAIGLRVEVDLAEKVKLEYAEVGSRVEATKVIEVDWEDEIYKFKARDVDLIIGSRLEEIFERLAKELKKMGQHSRLPGGIILSGGGSAIKGTEEVARDILKLPSKRAAVSSYETSTGDVLGTEWSTAVGLMLFDDKSFNDANRGGRKLIDQIFDRSKRLVFKQKM
ncbi:MAG: cell division protein FtsA [Patescibacteria group bacterium]|nr:cell division protein FtsA [Patescibacteria group bacterium]